MNDNIRILLAIVLSTLIMFLWQFISPKEENINQRSGNTSLNTTVHSNSINEEDIDIKNDDEHIVNHTIISGNNDSSSSTFVDGDNNTDHIRNDHIEDKSQRVYIRTKNLSGSINLKGAMIDDIILLGYTNNLDDEKFNKKDKKNKKDEGDQVKDTLLGKNQLVDSTNVIERHSDIEELQKISSFISTNDNVVLLSPINAIINKNNKSSNINLNVKKNDVNASNNIVNHDKAYYIKFGWISKTKTTSIILPNKQTIWKANKTTISGNDTVELSWVNPQNIKFVIQITLDNEYMFNIHQIVHNNIDKDIELISYAAINRYNPIIETDNMILHEGVAGNINNKLHEVSFKDITEKDNKSITYDDPKINWLGFSDKYWLVAIINNSQNAIAKVIAYNNTSVVSTTKNTAANINEDSHIIDKDDDAIRYQISITSPVQIIKSNDKNVNNIQLFVGAKELNLLEKYEKEYNIELFDRAVDFGILYFITKPIFLLLTYFYHITGNFGVAIILLTVLIKLLLFPLGYKGFKSMNKLKELGPKINNLKEIYGQDAVLLQKKMLDLYKKEKVNPVSGCLPIILQMPIFFALYKVLYVTIEMRHSPFIFWIDDLSARDPTTIFNLFGIINYTPPSILMVGVLPILMGVTMYIQQMLNPQPSDAVQANVMKFMPLIFTFIFASFPSGLVLYWTWSNILSIIQQFFIKKLSMRSI